MQHLSICYFTNRRNPRLHWFLDSLRRQIAAANGLTLKIVVVDFWATEWALLDAISMGERDGRTLWAPIYRCPPKPTVWQGPHRLTSRNYFAASNARNTAICLAPEGWIAFADDLSVLLPGWLESVRAAMAGNYIALGSYRKVNKLEVEGGVVKCFEEFPPGVDSRLKSDYVRDWIAKYGETPMPAGGSWMFGCSLAAPVQAFLDINGFDEDAEVLGGEDYLCGMMLEKAGYQFRYCPRMATLESEEAHGEDAPFLRVNKPYPGEKDASWAILNQVVSGKRLKAVNAHFGEGGLVGMRQRVLDGQPFPVPNGPTHHWPDNQPLAEM